MSPSKTSIFFLLFIALALRPHSAQAITCREIGRLLAPAVALVALGAWGALQFSAPPGFPPTDDNYSEDDRREDEALLDRALRGENAHPIAVRIPARGEKPRIVLYVERHDDAQCLQIADENRASAISGSCLLGEEGRLLTSEEGIRGIEEPSTRLLTIALLKLDAFDRPGHRLAKGIGFLKELSDAPEFSRPVWEKTKKSIERAVGDADEDSLRDMREHFQLVDSLFELKTEVERARHLKEHAKKLGVFGTALPLLTLPHLMDAQSVETRERYPALKLLEGIRTAKDIDTSEEKAAVWKVIVGMRDDSFARKILSLYEEESAGQGREVRVRMGAAHLPGVYQQLRTSLDAVEGGREVAIQVDERMLEFPKLQRLARFPALKAQVHRINGHERERILSP